MERKHNILRFHDQILRVDVTLKRFTVILFFMNIFVFKKSTLSVICTLNRHVTNFYENLTLAGTIFLRYAFMSTVLSANLTLPLYIFSFTLRTLRWKWPISVIVGRLRVSHL